ncbi:cysteine hydrolase family protein [Candidatus Poriferisocius sp.]|uniref:cysteine hydrolase family protein n=1 Tax=Candidatus Poriferisocius sp. TaxID=3101276 RepID=UPI003B02928D
MPEHRGNRPPPSGTPNGPPHNVTEPHNSVAANTRTPDCVIAVGIQTGFIAPPTQHIPAAVESFLARARVEHRFFTRFINPGPGGPFAKLLGWHKLQNPKETALAPEVEALATSVVEKNGYSPFSGTGLAAELERIGANTVLVCGIDTDVCVLSTAAGLFELGLHPVVVADLCASTGGTAAHTAALTILPRYTGAHNIITTTDLQTHN